MTNTRTATVKPKPAARPKTAPRPASATRKVPVTEPKAAAVKAAPAKVAPVKEADAVAPPKPAKLKLVRDSFTIPRPEYAVLDALKVRLVKLARPAKRSEVLRAGIKLLDTLPDAALLQALGAVPAVKTGRPGKTK